ncbi:MAG: hypothetical protein OXC37_03605 [Bdellovibrionaceae bacterium]|nr:hypothetical protein [Pseudobdellovibrionaceae bacterium]
MKHKVLLLFFLFSVSVFAETLDNLELSPDDSKSIKQLKIKNLSDLQKLTPKDSVSVIQKRYLPKTFRGEFKLSASTIVNHTFFYLGGVSGTVGFFIREDHGFGLEGFAWLPPLFKMTANDMINPPNQIVPLGVFLSQFYTGVYYKWSPFFGKFSVLNRKIVYFDMYMTFGGGINWVLDAVDVIVKQLNQTGRKLDERYSRQMALAEDKFPAFSVAVGQTFSMTQDWAFNWELKLINTILKYQNDRTYFPVDVNFSIGINYYFPGAKYR